MFQQIDKGFSNFFFFIFIINFTLFYFIWQYVTVISILIKVYCVKKGYLLQIHVLLIDFYLITKLIKYYN